MGEYISNDQGTPATLPDSGEKKLYPKTDGWYMLNSAGNEIKIDNTLFGTAAGTDTYTASIPNHSTTTYSQSVILQIKFTNANTGASTLNVNSIGATAIRKNSSSALISGDIAAGQVYTLQYDGTNFQILGKLRGHIIQNSGIDLATRTNLNFSGALTATDDAINNQSDITTTRTGVYRNVWIPASAMTPRITNGAAGATREYATNDIMSEYFLFDATTEEGVQFIIAMPDEWNLGTIKYKIYWDASTGASAADLVSWGVKAGALSNDDVIDTALGTQVVVDDIVIAVGDLHVSPASTALTVAGTPTLGDMCIFQIIRNVAGNDNMTEDAQLIGCLLQFQESTTEPVIW